MPKPVLLVDDDRLLVASMCDFLGSSGYETFSASNGEEALRVLDQVTPGLILLDIIMPVMSGYEFLRRLWQREDLADIPVIVISSSDVKNPVGPVGFLPKPIDTDALLAAVRARCGEPQATRTP